MPRYFFHLHNDIDCPDEEGLELPDLTTARMHAIHTPGSRPARRSRIMGTSLAPSTMASVLQARGLHNVVNMVGGYGAWQQAGLPVEK